MNISGEDPTAEAIRIAKSWRAVSAEVNSGILADGLLKMADAYDELRKKYDILLKEKTNVQETAILGRKPWSKAEDLLASLAFSSEAMRPAWQSPIREELSDSDGWILLHRDEIEPLRILVDITGGRAERYTNLEIDAARVSVLKIINS